jgi:hypothetical protein
MQKMLLLFCWHFLALCWNVIKEFIVLLVLRSKVIKVCYPIRLVSKIHCATKLNSTMNQVSLSFLPMLRMQYIGI